MMKSLLAFAGVLSAVYAARAGISGEELVERAILDAVHDAQIALASAPIPSGKAVAVLPMNGDSERSSVRALVKSALTAAGKTCVEGKEDALVDEIAKEMAWDERKEDILDASTVDRFGRLKSAQYLVYGGFRRLATDKRYVLVELELHATEIATKRHVWGKVFARRLYAPADDPNGRIDVPIEVRDTMRGKFRESLAASLKKSAKLASVKKVACLPVVADIDQYVGGLVRDVLSSSAALTPVNLDVETRAEARFALKESPGKGDAILYGALRDASATLMSVDFWKQKTYRGQMEIQLWIENGATREILWSDTIAASQEFLQPNPYGPWDKICAALPILQGRQWLVVVLPLILLVGLVALIVIVKNATRVR